MTALVRIRQLLEGIAAQPPAPGYCPHCGRGDCAPTPDEYEQQRQRADRAEAVVTRVRAVLEDPNHTNMILTKTVRAALAAPGPAATEPVVLRDPCPRCEGSPTRIPRHTMTDHMRTHHPEVAGPDCSQASPNNAEQTAKEK